MADSLDYVRVLAEAASAEFDTREIARAMLKLADELVDTRKRVSSLELDSQAQGTRLDIIKQHTTNLQTLVDRLERECTELADDQINVGDRVNIHRDNIEILIQRSHSLELDRDQAALISAGTSQHVSDIANILRETIELVESANRRIHTVNEAVRNIDGRVGQLEGL